MKKKLTTLLLILIATGTSLSANPDVEEPPQRKKVGLVLSGGGAKGVAHIGVLKVLEEAGIPIDYIAGTSMGAIMGGLYAIGYSPKELDSLARNQDWMFLLSDRVARQDKLITEKEITDTYVLSVPVSFDKKMSLPSGMLAGQSVLNLLNELTIGYHDESCCFDSLPVPFACVTYDMVKGEEVVFRNGNLPLAIRASMAIPGAFAPVVKDSMVLVDGGIYNNFPVDVVKEMGADVIIGVDLSGGPADAERLGTMMGLIDQITNIMGREKYSVNKDRTDLYLHPKVKPYTSASFSPEAIDSLLARGERVARENWDEIMALKETLCIDEYCELPAPRQIIEESDSIRVGNIHFLGLTRNEEVLIRPALRIEEHSMITKGDLNDAIRRLRGSGAFSYVTYTLESKEPNDLYITVNEKQMASVNIGFRIDTEQIASILFNTTLHFRGMQGPRLGVTARVNDNPYVKLDFTSSRWLLGRLGVSYMYRHTNYKLYNNGRSTSSVNFGLNRVSLYFLDANPMRFSFNLGACYEHFDYRSFLFASERDFLEVKPEGFINYFFKGSFESLNNRYYPTKGVSLRTELTLHTDNGYSHDGGVPFGSIYYNFNTAFTVIPRYDRLVIMPALYGRTVVGNSIAYGYLNYMGGEMTGRYMDQQLPFVGVKHIESFGRSLMAASVEVRMRLFSRHYISAHGAYAIHDNNFFDMFNNAAKGDDVWGVGLKYSYDSPIGPISAVLSRSNIDKSIGFYFSMGKTF